MTDAAENMFTPREWIWMDAIGAVLARGEKDLKVWVLEKLADAEKAAREELAERLAGGDRGLRLDVAGWLLDLESKLMVSQAKELAGLKRQIGDLKGEIADMRLRLTALGKDVRARAALGLPGPVDDDVYEAEDEPVPYLQLVGGHG